MHVHRKSIILIIKKKKQTRRKALPPTHPRTDMHVQPPPPAKPTTLIDEFHVQPPPPPPPRQTNNINTAHRGPFQVNVEEGAKFLLKLIKNKMALSKTNRDGTRQIGGARAWCAVEQFRAASSLLFHYSNLTFLFVVHARNRHDLRSHVLVGNTTLRRTPCIGS